MVSASKGLDKLDLAVGGTISAGFDMSLLFPVTERAVIHHTNATMCILENIDEINDEQ
jgi:hypothetical protein